MKSTRAQEEHILWDSTALSFDSESTIRSQGALGQGFFLTSLRLNFLTYKVGILFCS